MDIHDIAFCKRKEHVICFLPWHLCILRQYLPRQYLPFCPFTWNGSVKTAKQFSSLADWLSAGTMQRKLSRGSFPWSPPRVSWQSKRFNHSLMPAQGTGSP
jgi:hypothetical protein